MNYWDKFYQKQNFNLKNPSDFAKYVCREIDSNKKIIDIGCGNGRDALYFENQGHHVIGLDKSKFSNYLGANFKSLDVTKKNIEGEVYYARFFIHTLTEKQLESFLEVLFEKMKEGNLLFIETRSTTNISNDEKMETYFKLTEGDAHFRMLYSKNYLQKKISKYFKIISSEESDSFAIHKSEKPFVIRIKATKKNKSI